jgi:hypothetical protein
MDSGLEVDNHMEQNMAQPQADKREANYCHMVEHKVKALQVDTLEAAQSFFCKSYKLNGSQNA